MNRTVFYLIPFICAFSCAQPEPKTTDADVIEEEAPARELLPPTAIERSATTGMNILGIIDSRPDLSIFRELLHVSYVEGIVENPTEYTVFAPTNAAFEALPKETLEEMRKPSGASMLRPIISLHIAQGVQNARAINSKVGNGKFEQKMVGGKMAVLSLRNGELYINEARIIETDLSGSNGTVHIVDKIVTSGN